MENKAFTKALAIVGFAFGVLGVVFALLAARGDNKTGNFWYISNDGDKAIKVTPPAGMEIIIPAGGRVKLVLPKDILDCKKPDIITPEENAT